jgi:pimeloyl-ACP methyl ester carboxylesterase
MPFEAQPDFDIEYDEATAGDFRVRTILTLPRRPGKLPAVMLVQGVGCFSVDHPVTGDDAYQKILYALTRAGYVTMRVDKPGMGDSEGGPCLEAGFHRELAAYRAGLSALKRCRFVDPGRVFLFGHSMGGVMAPLLAATEPLAGVAVYGTVFKSWLEYELENSRRQEYLRGEDPAAIEETMRARHRFLSLLYVERWPLERILEEHPEFREKWTAPPVLYAGKHHRYFQEIYDLNLAREWQKVAAPVLAIWGTSDFVSTEWDHARIAEVVNSRHPGNGAFHALPGIDHSMNRAVTPEASLSGGSNGGEFDTRIVDVLLDWLARTDSGRGTR